MLFQLLWRAQTGIEQGILATTGPQFIDVLDHHGLLDNCLEPMAGPGGS
jgi:hypothetical protein